MEITSTMTSEPTTDFPSELQESVLAVQAGVIQIQQGIIEILGEQGPNLMSPTQNAALELQKGAVEVLKGALGLQRSAGQLSRATERQSFSAEPDHVQFNAQGVNLASQARYSEAIIAFQKASDLDPSSPEIFKNLADACLNSGLLGRAIESYEKAISLRPGYREAMNNLAITCLNQGDYKRAEQVLKQAMHRDYGMPSTKTERFEPSEEAMPNQPPPAASPFKLQDRIEQLGYLLDNQLIDQSFRELLHRLNSVRTRLQNDDQRKPYAPLASSDLQTLGGYFDRLIFYEDAPRINSPTMNESLDYKALEDNYMRTRCLYFDEFLTPAALASLRRFFMRSTIFWRFSEAGFVASYVMDGFNCGLVFQLIEELHERFPRILKGKHLNNMWCYRYCSHGDGVRPHNGDGSVTINFYLTPDDANLAPEGGGMVMYDKEHPRDWDWLKYNMHKDDPAIQADIAKYLVDAKAERVPYRCNRAVLFHSTLFHKTDPYQFRDGYENRRMNITMLFGKRGQESAAMI